jgi:hypothetical protein
MNQQWHILHLPVQGMRPLTFLFAKVPPHVLLSFGLNASLGCLLTMRVLISLSFFFFPSSLSSFCLPLPFCFGVAMVSSVCSLEGSGKANGSFSLKVLKQTCLMRDVKFKMESLTWFHWVCSMHSLSQSWKHVSVGTKMCKFPLPVMRMPVRVLRSVCVQAHARTGTGICI